MPVSADIKQVSPFDAAGCCSPAPLVNIAAAQPTQWLPSQFNSRTTNEDGRIVVWNSKTGAISIFGPEQKPALEAYLSQVGYQGALTPLGRYLKERGFIVPAETNEFRQFQVLFGQQHFRTDTLELILLATEDCNFRCEYCYEEFKRGTMRPDVRARLKKLVEQRATGLRNFGVSWFGGEPLYGFAAIEDLSPHFLDLANRHSMNYSVSITTNGYLLTPERAEKLLAWKCNKYQITIDGPAEQHNRNRPARDGSGTFETIFSNLQYLKSTSHEFFVRIRVNVSPHAVPHMEDLLALLERAFGSDERFGVAFYSAGKWGGPNDEKLETCGVRDFRDLKTELEANAARKGLRFGTLADSNRPGGQVCYAARPYNFVIGADGKVMKCTVALDNREDNIVGSITEEGDLKLNEDYYSLWVEPAYEQDAGCQRCHLLPSCQGISCPLIRIVDHVSPCAATVKHNLHNELVGMVKARQTTGRQVGVGAGA